MIEGDLNCGLGGIMLRRRAYDPRVVSSKLGLATFEESMLGQGIKTHCASFHPGV